MIWARFHANPNDYRPVNWPVKHPYWCTGHGEDYSVIVAYADNLEELLTNWPEATMIDSFEHKEYEFTSRFPKPKWFNAVISPSAKTKE